MNQADQKKISSQTWGACCILVYALASAVAHLIVCVVGRHDHARADSEIAGVQLDRKLRIPEVQTEEVQGGMGPS